MRSEKRIKPFMEWLTKKWEESPDQRFGQFLINKGIVEDGILTWNSEIVDYQLPHEVIREIQTWGTYGKDGNKFEEKFIKDLDTEHIEAILTTQEHISKELEMILKNELKFRRKE
jgi:hypothetical protein